jgi:hypothetical protein
MTTENTQITSVIGYDVNNLIFSEPISGSIPDSKPKIEFKRINISTKNDDGTTGELIFPTSRLFSFGITENTSQETGNINSYTFPICLWSKEGPTEEEKAWTDTFEKIVEACTDYIISVKDEIDMFDLTKTDLTKTKGGLNPLYWKREKFTNSQGKTVLRVVPDTGPTLYTKLIYSKKNEKFLSQFFDTNDEPIDALSLMGKYCFTKAAIKIESIFIGSKISLQVKLYEAVIEPANSGMKRLLARPKANSKVLEMESSASSSRPPLTMGDDEKEETGSLVGEDDILDLPEQQDKPVATTIRKVKKVTKK